MARESDTELVSTDVDTIDELVSQLNVAANKLEDQISAIYEKIAALNEVWAGDSYNNFNDKCNEAKPALDALVLFVRAYAELLDSTVSSSAQKYINDATRALGGVSDV